MRQLVYQVCYTRYHVSFYLWLIGSALKHCKVPNIMTMTVGIKFHFKPIILIFRTKVGQKWYFKSKTKKKFFFFLFSIWVFVHEHSRFTGQQGKEEGIYLTPLYHFHPLHRHLDISRAIAAESSPLRIAGSRTRTGNLWFPSASR